jgi:xylan 1,4-beta-xylosidase
VGIRPILELSFMPEDIAEDPTKTIMHYKGGTSPPKDYALWDNLITGIYQGLVERYGVEELRTWRTEVWNEPNGCGFWCPKSGAFQEEYFTLYNHTVLAIKSVDSLLSVGGPATAGLAWIGDFVNFTQANAVPASFLSTHSYPTDLRHGPFNRTTYEDQIIAAAEVAGAGGLPLVLTEMSAGLNNAYDAPFAAALLVHEAAAFLGVPNVPTMSFWTFT